MDRSHQKILVMMVTKWLLLERNLEQQLEEEEDVVGLMQLQ